MLLVLDMTLIVLILVSSSNPFDLIVSSFCSYVTVKISELSTFTSNERGSFVRITDTPI